MDTSIPARRHSLFNPVQFLGAIRIGGVAGMAGGLAAGIVARLVMRLVALLSGTIPVFTLQGTLFILGLGIFMGLWIGILFGFLLPFLPGPITRKGLLFGLAPALIFATLILLVEPEGELALVSRWITAAGLASTPLVYGVVLGQVAARLAPQVEDTQVESGQFSRTAGLLTMLAASLGAIIEGVLGLTHPAIINLGFVAGNTLGQAGGVCLVLMSFLGLSGLIRSGAAGESRPAKLGLGFALAIVALLSLISIYERPDSLQLHGLVRLLDGRAPLYSDWLLLAPLLVGVLAILVVGIAVLRAGRWAGWRAYTPLAVGLILLLSFLILHPSLLPAQVIPPVSVRTQISYGLGMLYSLGWLGVGMALRTGNSSRPPASGNSLEAGAARG
jgi:hypothetical protein